VVDGVLNRELSALYGAFAAGTALELPELPVQYGDYSAWQQQWIEKRRARRSDRLLEVPACRRTCACGAADRPPSSASQSFRGAVVRSVLPFALLDGLKAIGERRERRCS